MTIEVRQMVIKSELEQQQTAPGRPGSEAAQGDDCGGENSLAQQPHRSARAEQRTLLAQLERMRER